jgi:hypothetical protein
MQDWQERIEERLKKVEEQQNKPINLTVEHRYPDIEVLQEMRVKLTDLERNQHELRSELHTHSETWLDALQEHENQRQADMANIKATLSDHSEALKHTATKQEIAAMESRLNENISAVRTEMKTDMAAMENRIVAAVKQLLSDNKG